MEYILDVGCGNNPMGDVNVDLYIGVSKHRDSRVLVPQNIPNFVLCDAAHLSFRDDCFEKVFSKDSLEHVGKKPQSTNPGPYMMLKEMIRVSKGDVEIYVPHRFSIDNCEKRFWIRRHNAFFNLRWFKWAIPKIEKELGIRTSIFAEIIYKPIFLYFLLMPDRIHILIRKREEV